jgi:hypothetical protein
MHDDDDPSRPTASQLLAMNYSQRPLVQGSRVRRQRSDPFDPQAEAQKPQWDTKDFMSSGQRKNHAVTEHQMRNDEKLARNLERDPTYRGDLPCGGKSRKTKQQQLVDADEELAREMAGKQRQHEKDKRRGTVLARGKGQAQGHRGSAGAAVSISISDDSATEEHASPSRGPKRKDHFGSGQESDAGASQGDDDLQFDDDGVCQSKLPSDSDASLAHVASMIADEKAKQPSKKWMQLHCGKHSTV